MGGGTRGDDWEPVESWFNQPDYRQSVGLPVESKPSNPKDLIGSDKLPLSQLPVMGKAYQALGHLEGTLKYGLVNWRECGVRFSIYMDAMERHMGKLKEGEWADVKTRVPHLGSIMACCAILADAYECGKLIDDRPKEVPGIGQKLDDLSEVVKHLKELFKDYSPHHYTHEGDIAA